MVRLAVAVWPPPKVIEVLVAFERPEVAGVRWSTPEQWMVKLRPLGHVDERVVPQLVEVLEFELDGAPAARPCAAGAGGPAGRRVVGRALDQPGRRPLVAARAAVRGRGGAAADGLSFPASAVMGGRYCVPRRRRSS